MTKYRRLAQFGAVVGVAALGLAACGGSSGGGNGGSSSNTSTQSSYNAATTSIVNASNKTGGTLKLIASGDCDSFDPARTYYAWCWDMQRLFTRTLMGYQRAPGTAGLKVVPDLATAPGQASADGLTWTYHLQPGLKYQNGQPITTADIKYGIERLYATSVINGGPNFYYLCLLDTCDSSGNPTYKGPYADKTGNLTQIDTPDATTIVFHLNYKYGDMDYLMSLPASAPVPKASDTGATYSQHVVSSGPFEFQSYSPGKSAVWVRNPNWSQSTDKIREPKVTEVLMNINSNSDANDQALKAGQYDLEPDGGIQPTFQAQVVTDPSLKKYADDPVTGFTRYLVVAPTFAPLDNVHCRRAIFYAISKSDLQRARGGTYGGNIATTMAPPTVPGYDPNANMYPDGPNNTGDVTKAKQELALCGKPNGFTVNGAYSNTGKGPAVFAAEQQALAKAGITLTAAPADQASYYSTFIGSPANIVAKKLGVMQAGWGADFPTCTGFWNSIVNGAAILPTGNTNYASLNDPIINGALKTALTYTDPHSSQANATCQTIDKQVMNLAVMLPFQYDKTLYYHAPNLTNLYLQAGLGYYYDYVNVGVS
jgi:peptide/nickel transport system substrate-binding protein